MRATVKAHSNLDKRFGLDSLNQKYNGSLWCLVLTLLLKQPCTVLLSYTDVLANIDTIYMDTPHTAILLACPV